MVLRESAALIAPPDDVVNENVAALEALAATRSVNETLNAGLVTLSPICGKVPEDVVSLMTGLPAAKSSEVPAAMLAKAACEALGVVNFVTVKVTTAAALKVPAVSFTVNTELANATVHEAPEGAVTAQTLGLPEVSTAMPEPDSVILIPALAPAVIAVAGVKEHVAVVCVALREEASVIARPLMSAPLAMCNESASAAKNKRLGCARNIPDFELLLKTRCEAEGIFKGARAKAQISFGLACCNFRTMRRM